MRCLPDYFAQAWHLHLFGHILYIHIAFYFSTDLLGARGQRGLHVVRVVLDVVVLQDRINTIALLLPAFLWTRSLGC